MPSRKFALGLDFGTESVRALLVDVESGDEVASGISRYSHGVIDDVLPGTNKRLPPEWALQDATDYKRSMHTAIDLALGSAGTAAHAIIGVGIDFTSCTILPTTIGGTPLSELPQHHDNPHAWIKLWKHHAAQPEATRITELAIKRNEGWISRYGGKVSSEWMHSKVLQILDDAPEIYSAADRFIEAGDWIVWQLTGIEQRNACAAGYKALWDSNYGYPDEAFLTTLDTRLVDLPSKLSGRVEPPGTLAGHVTEESAKWSGLVAGTPVGMATIDAHAAVLGSGVYDEGTLVMILGTSTCHMLLSREEHLIEGIAGTVKDGILPGYFGYEAGQAGVGDSFEWFQSQAVPAYYREQASQEKLNTYQLLERDASKLAPGESGLLALDWWNGNRSILADAELSGAIFGLTLRTKPYEIYRALIEATAFGTKVIIDQFESGGVNVNGIVASGGLATHNTLLLQIYADVTGREIQVAESKLASALGAAIFGAIAATSKAGGYDSAEVAAKAMSKPPAQIIRPIPTHQQIYQSLFAEYRTLHDAFGRGALPTLKRLRSLREGADHQ